MWRRAVTKAPRLFFQHPEPPCVDVYQAAQVIWVGIGGAGCAIVDDLVLHNIALWLVERDAAVDIACNGDANLGTATDVLGVRATGLLWQDAHCALNECANCVAERAGSRNGCTKFQ